MFNRYKKKMLIPLLAFSAFAWVLPVTSASAAGTDRIVLVLDGIKGEGTDQTLKGGIVVWSMSFGASSTVTSNGSAGKQIGKTEYSSLSLSKSVDSATLPLIKNLAKSTIIPEGTLYFYSSSDTQPYLSIQMKDIAVVSDQISGSSVDDRPMESVSLSAGEMIFNYTSVNSKAGPGAKQTLDIQIDKNVVK